MKRNDVRKILEDETLDASEKIKRILDLHHEETDSLREELETAQSEKKTAEDALTAANTAKEKAEKDLADYRTEQGKNAARAKKETAYRELLKKIGVNEKAIDLIIKAERADLDNLELAEDGTFKEASKLTEDAKSKHADFIGETKETGAQVKTPPAGGKGGMSKADIIKIADPVARQKAIADNPQAFT